MNGRGRPRTPDILTPREWEVLALLRRGLSNREIADEMGISLAGAKFHVSEIISKLGVSSRDEAVGWDEARQSSRWVGLPLLGRLKRLWPRSLVLKLAVMGAFVMALGGLGAVAAVLVWSNSNDASGSATASVSPTPIVCHSGATCAETPVQYATLELAVAVASFKPLLPSNIPSTFKQTTVVASQRDFSNPYVPQVHNDWITITSSR